MITSTCVVALGAVLLAVPAAVLGVAPPAAAAPTNGPIVYRAIAGDADHLDITLSGSDLLIVNTGATRLPASLAGRCAPRSAAQGVAASCPAKGDLQIVLDLKDGDDVVDARHLLARFRMSAELGAGDDVLFSGEGDSVLHGGPGTDVIEGGDGDDRLYGDAGDGFLDGGPGNDLIDASGTDAGGVNTLFGQDGSDLILGGNGLDFIYTDGDTDLDPSNDSGRDVVDGRGGVDFIDGGGDADVLNGGAGDDEITGDDSIDPDTGKPYLVTGVDGPDVITGGSGNDFLVGLGGRDLLGGGADADEIDARDGEVDLVACGAGVDSAQVDTKPADRVEGGCETVGRAAARASRSGAVASEQTEAIAEMSRLHANARAVGVDERRAALDRLVERSAT